MSIPVLQEDQEHEVAASLRIGTLFYLSQYTYISNKYQYSAGVFIVYSMRKWHNSMSMEQHGQSPASRYKKESIWLWDIISVNLLASLPFCYIPSPFSGPSAGPPPSYLPQCIIPSYQSTPHALELRGYRASTTPTQF